MQINNSVGVWASGPTSATPALTMTPKLLRRARRSHSKGGGGCECGEGTLEVALAGDALV